MRIVRGSGGAFLCPPGDPRHEYHIEDGQGRNPNLIASLDYALDEANTDVPEALRARVREILARAQPVCSEQWVRYVYAYFRNCYSPDGVNRNVSDCITAKAGEPLPPAQRHLGYLYVRERFPDHEVRADLLADGSGYGTRPCVKCKRTLQYEARVDAFAEAITARRTCPAGGEHEAAEAQGGGGR